MPRQYDGPTLVRVTGRRNWYIQDWIDGRTRRFSTRCPHGGADQPDLRARAVLARYIKEKGEIRKTIPELLGARLKSFEGRDGHSRVKSENKRLKAHFTCYPEDLTRALVEEYIEARKDTPIGCRRDLEALRTICRKALIKAGEDPKEIIPLPANRSPRERFASRQEFAKFLTTAAQTAAHVYIFARIAGATGARRGAILDLTWDRVYLDQDNPAIDFNVPGREITKKRRTATPIGKQLAGELRALRALAESNFVVEYMGKGIGDIKHAWGTVARKAGMAWLTPHILKHSAVSWLAQDGYDEGRIGDLTATERNTISRIYRKVNPEHLTDLADALDFLPGNAHGVADMRRAHRRKPQEENRGNLLDLAGGRYRDRTCDLAGVNQPTGVPKRRKPLKTEGGAA